MGEPTTAFQRICANDRSRDHRRAPCWRAARQATPPASTRSRSLSRGLPSSRRTTARPLRISAQRWSTRPARCLDNVRRHCGRSTTRSTRTSRRVRSTFLWLSADRVYPKDTPTVRRAVGWCGRDRVLRHALARQRHLWPRGGSRTRGPGHARGDLGRRQADRYATPHLSRTRTAFWDPDARCRRRHATNSRSLPHCAQAPARCPSTTHRRAGRRCTCHRFRQVS